MILFRFFLYLHILRFCILVFFFFFNDTATTEIYTLSLHDALPISRWSPALVGALMSATMVALKIVLHSRADRKSTRLNSSHANISYAVFCLKKQNKNYSAHSFTQKNKIKYTEV